MSTTGSYVIIWHFKVRAGQQPAFETVYGPNGEWAKLFSLSTDFLGTLLLRSAEEPARYATIDRWASAASFRRFLEVHGSEYGALDAKCEGLTEAEVAVGTWTPVLA